MALSFAMVAAEQVGKTPGLNAASIETRRNVRLSKIDGAGRKSKVDSIRRERTFFHPV